MQSPLLLLRHPLLLLALALLALTAAAAAFLLLLTRSPTVAPLRPADTHPPALAEPELGIVHDALGELNRTLLEVHDERLAFGLARLVRVELDARLIGGTEEEDATLGEDGGELGGGHVEWETAHVDGRRLLGLLLGRHRCFCRRCVRARA
jgi:hypothetical protein